MSAPAAALRDLLARRIELVGRLSQTTGALQRLLQTRAGAELDVQRCEMALDREPADAVARDLLEQELAEARERVEASERGLETCDAEIAALETGLAETDREIETAARA